jgi:hypothetical protein
MTVLSKLLKYRVFFLFSGVEAVVRCFACDGRFQKLKSVDEIWLDHCYFFPTCPYMESRIGKRFIKIIQETISDITAEVVAYFII